MLEYAIIEFIDEQAVEVVHKTWLKKEERGLVSYWPKSNCRQKARKKELPDKESWSKYPVRILSDTDDFEKALNRLKRAVETSNIDSESEQENERRESRPPARYDSESEDIVLERPRKTSKGSNVNKKADIRPPTPPNYNRAPQQKSPLRERSPVRREQSSRERSPQASTCSSSYSYLSPQASSSSHSRSFTPTNVARSPQAESTSSNYRYFNPTTVPRSYRERSPQPSTSSFRSITPTSSRFNSSTYSSERSPRTLSPFQESPVIPQRSSSYEEKMFVAITRMDATIAENNMLLRKILSCVLPQNEFEGCDLESLLPQPINSDEEMRELTEKLVDPDFKKKLVYFLGLLGGKTLRETIRTILRKIATNQLWSKYNLTGKNPKKMLNTEQAKKSLKTEEIYKVIKKACMKTHKDASESSIDEAISETLKRAPHQPGGSKFQKPDEEDQDD